MTTTIYLGIDPGLGGVLAVIDGETVALHETPTVPAKRGREYVPDAMAALLRPYAGQATCIVEMVSAAGVRPGATLAAGDVQARGGSRNTLKMGRGVGLWEGLLAAYEIPCRVVYAQTWKRFYGLLKADKAASRERAQALFPSLHRELERRRTDFSEALLLAHYGRAVLPPVAMTGPRKEKH